MTQPVDIVMDQDLSDEFNALEGEIDLLETQVRVDTEHNHPEYEVQLDAKRADLDALRDRMAEENAVVRFTFQALGGDEYDALLNLHQPTPDQRAKAKEVGMVASYNEDTWPPAIVAACLVSPELSTADVAQIYKSPKWNQAELGQLTGCAMFVNQNRRKADLGKDFGRIRPTAPNSTT